MSPRNTTAVARTRFARGLEVDPVLVRPEPRNLVERLAVARSSSRATAIGVAPCVLPVLVADIAAGPRIESPRHVARGEDALDRRLAELVDDDAVVDDEAGVFGQLGVGSHADPDDDEIGRDRSGRRW